MWVRLGEVLPDVINSIALKMDANRDWRCRNFVEIGDAKK